MRLKPFATILITLFLGACSSLPEHTHLNTDLQQPSCCATLTSLPLTALSSPFHQRVLMDAEQPRLNSAVLFPERTTSSQPLPVMSYEIKSKTPIALLVRSYVNHHAVFAANVRVYNAHWQLLTNDSVNDFTYHTTGMRGLERVEHMLTINPALNGAKYVVITADPTQIGQTLTRKSQEKVYAETQHVIGNKQPPLTATFQAVGIIDVTASTSQDNDVLTLLSELGARDQPTTEPAVTTAAAPQAKQQWAMYQDKIDAALEAKNIKQAAQIANQAEAQGFQQAQGYLVKQLAK